MIFLIMGMVMILVMNVLEISTDFGNIIPLVSLLMLILMFCRLAFSRPSSILFLFLFFVQGHLVFVVCVALIDKELVERKTEAETEEFEQKWICAFVTNSLNYVDC